MKGSCKSTFTGQPQHYQDLSNRLSKCEKGLLEFIILNNNPLQVSSFLCIYIVRRSRCGDCRGCKAQDCKRCKNCQDQKRYGGPGKRKRPCVDRKCLNLVSIFGTHTVWTRKGFTFWVRDSTSSFQGLE